jgi:hypothetical protein
VASLTHRTCRSADRCGEQHRAVAHGISSTRNLGAGPAATSSPIVTRSKSHRCSTQHRTRRVVVGGGGGEDDIVGVDAVRRRKTGMKKEVETVSTSHYYRRHRHRARNQSRAMRQVAEWIERAEPSSRHDEDECECERSAAKKGASCRHEHYHYHYHYCVDANAWGIC